MRELRSDERNGKINLNNTRFIALSAVSKDQFEQTEGYDLFDDFSKLLHI